MRTSHCHYFPTQIVVRLQHFATVNDRIEAVFLGGSIIYLELRPVQMQTIRLKKTQAYSPHFATPACQIRVASDQLLQAMIAAPHRAQQMAGSAKSR